MTDLLQPIKFYPYYKVKFMLLINGERHIFSYPENFNDIHAFGSLATNIEINKSEQGILSSLAMRIYNMAADKRNLLFKEPYYVLKTKDPEKNEGFIKLELGYLSYENNQRSITWEGEIISASSYKQGDNIITEINAREGAFLEKNAFIQVEIKKGETVGKVLERIIPQLINDARYADEVKRVLAEEADFIDTTKIKTSFDNDYVFTKDKIINDTFYNTFMTLISYIPNSTVSKQEDQYYATDHVSIGEPEFIINAESGMQSTPKIYGERITLTTMFEPAIDIESFVRVESLIEPNINGDYAVKGYTHSLTLGDGTNASAVTNLNLLMQGLAE